MFICMTLWRVYKRVYSFSFDIVDRLLRGTLRNIQLKCKWEWIFSWAFQRSNCVIIVFLLEIKKVKRAERRKKVCSVCIYAIQTSVVGIEGGGECSIRLVPQKNERRRRRREKQVGAFIISFIVITITMRQSQVDWWWW